VRTCKSKNCSKKIRNPKHNLCYDCWKKENKKDSGFEALTSTKIGKEFGLNGQKINLLFSELGWIYKPKHRKGWQPTRQGNKQGAFRAEMERTGVPYVLWEPKIIENKIFRRTVSNYTGETLPDIEENTATIKDDFRKKFPAKIRCMDGHFVRSRAEAMIDNWLYTNGIAHAYERKLPIEEDVYCDFYIMKGNVYIEFWGMENNKKYASRKKIKLEIYEKYDYNLIEIDDSEVINLDDLLPRKLLKFGISVD
jgi:hypothetical protein